MTTVSVESPLSWVGGKYVSAKRILAAFPPPHVYGTYCEVFGGAAHVLVRKQKERHLEVYNDLNGDLINFWMVARDHTQAIQERIDTLPYSRMLYHRYRDSLNAQTAMDDVERAARWFYVLRCSFGGGPDFSNGWAYTINQHENLRAHSLRTATALLAKVAERFHEVQIEHQDFETLIKAYQTPRTMFYADPPYIGCESYYTVEGMPPFTQDDHTRLAALLNATPALVALSYYEHPLLDDLYPASRWRRMTWSQSKAIEKTRGRRQMGQEVLLMNYVPTLGGLWHDEEAI